MILMFFLSSLKQLIFGMFYRRGYIWLFFPSFFKLVEAYPTCWIVRTSHKWPPVWFTVTYDCYFSLSCSYRMWLIPLINFMLLFKISMMEMLIKCATIWRILKFVIFLGMPPNALLYFRSSYGICSIKLSKSF